MTERGLPIVDGAPACPFVAFADDRDERATSPDHRHRCYAEAEPAPRALAHQEAYCLSSAFPVCPTFQDWARREAARTRPPETPPPGDDDDDFPPLVPDRPQRRSGQSWSAPPPWLRSQPGQADAGPSGDPRVGPGTSTAAPAGGTGASAESAGAAWAAAAGAAVGGAAAGGAAAGGAAAGGLAGSFADRLASNREPAPSSPEPEWEEAGGDDWEEDDRSEPPPAGSGHPQAAMGGGPVRQAGLAPRRREHEHSDAGRDLDPREQDVRAPAWERPRRLEAYPTIRSRRLSRAVPSILVALVAVLLAAAALFFLPSLLGIGSGPGGSPTPGPSTAPGPSVSEAPTVAPAATPFFYTVQSGDTMSKIANRFHVPLATLIDANRTTIPNPDKIKIGDQVIIPTATPSVLPGASATP